MSIASSVAGSAAGSTRRGVTSTDRSGVFSAHRGATQHSTRHSGTRNGPGGSPGRSNVQRLRRWELLDFDRGAGLGQLGLGSLCGFLGGLLENGLGGTVDEVLGFLQAQAGQLAHDLDDLDLPCAGFGEDDVELVLLLLDRGSGGCTTTGGRDGYRGGGGDAELLFERVEQFLELDHGHTGNGIEDIVLGKCCHGSFSFTKFGSTNGLLNGCNGSGRCFFLIDERLEAVCEVAGQCLQQTG